MPLEINVTSFLGHIKKVIKCLSLRLSCTSNTCTYICSISKKEQASDLLKMTPTVLTELV